MLFIIAVVVAVCVLVFVYYATLLAAIGALLLFLSGALIVGTPLFWGLVIVVSILLFWCLDGEDPDAIGGMVSTTAIIGILILFQAWGSFKPFSLMYHYPVRTAGVIAGYFIIGGLWSICKWWFVETTAFRRVKNNFLTYYSIRGTVIPEEHRKKWAEHVLAAKTDPRGSQNRFMSWIAYWPWSLVWTMLDEPLKRAARRIYEELQSTYQRITDRVWRVE